MASYLPPNPLYGILIIKAFNAITEKEALVSLAVAEPSLLSAAWIDRS